MTDPATVLYLVDGLGLSGKTKAMVDLVCGLDPARYRAVVARFDVDDSPLLQPLRARGIPLFDVPCPDGLNAGVMWRLGRLFRQVRPAVVHCYNPRTMLYGGIVARALGIRATVGSLSAFACLTPDRQYEFLPQRLFTTSPRNRLRNRVVARLMRAVVTVSRSLGERFCRFNGIDTGRLRVVSYGVDVARFSAVTPDETARFRDGIGVPRDAFVIGSVGRLVEQKDYPTQLRAFAELRRARAAAAPRPPAAPPPDPWMVLAGDGPLRQELEALAAELAITERVRFIGHNSQVPTLLRALDVFVISSKFEPYGVALLEAKASATAIAATSVNEIPELVPAEEMGLLVPAGDWQALGRAFGRLVENQDLRMSLGRRAAADAAVRHSLTAAIDGYQKIYDEVR
jgi:glycosyltransferase involved in cell wall biosynthesis